MVKFIAMNAYKNKTKTENQRSQINNSMLQFKLLESKNKLNPKLVEGKKSHCTKN
jgi:hypothetical protein